jgi:hypothetical protein
MSSRTTARLTDAGPAVPAMGTLNALADELYPKGTIVTKNTDGRAVSPASADTSGFPAMGVAKATFDNRTGSEMGGDNDDGVIELDYGVFGFDYTGTVPQPGDRMFVVDNQTVSIDPTGPRGFAGFCSEVRTVDGLGAQCFVWMGPHVMATADEIDLSAAEAAIADLELDATVGFLPVSIGQFPVWVDNTTNGLNPATYAFDMNPTIDDQPWRCAVALPADLDDTEDIVVHARVAISSIATDDDVTVVLVARINGGSDVAPVNATVLSVAAQNLTFTIPASSVPAGSRSLYLELDCAGTLDTHDARLYAVGIAYTRIQDTV